MTVPCGCLGCRPCPNVVEFDPRSVSPGDGFAMSPECEECRRGTPDHTARVRSKARVSK